MRRWLLLTALSLAVAACANSAGRSKGEQDVPANPVDSLLVVLSGDVPSPELKVKDLSGTYGGYRLSDEDRNRIAEGFAAISEADAKLHDYLLPALQEELRSCETFADVCRRLGLAEE